MDFKPQIFDIIEKIGELPVSKIKKLIHVQAEYVEYQEKKKHAVIIKKLQDRLEKKKSELNQELAMFK